MDRKWIIIIAIALVSAGILVSGALFTVHQTQQALVLQLGEPKRAVSEPGLKIKIPFIQNAFYYERRVLNVDPPVQRVILADQKPLLVDTYARYRIVDPLRFYQTVRTEGTASSRLSVIINASARGVLGNVNLASVLSEERADIMTQIQEQVNDEAQRFGIDLVDVRIRRSDLPDETSQAVYDRMKSEREREAAEFRAQAEREAEILRGEGEGERTRILNDAYGQDEEFFSFYRSMQAYDASLPGTYMVISPDGEFADFFEAIGDPTRPGQGSIPGN